MVWILDLMLAKIVGKTLGAAEELSPWSSLQLIGLFISLCGIFVYSGINPLSYSDSKSSMSTPLIDTNVGANDVE